MSLQLSDTHMISQACKMFSCEAEPLYWKMEDYLEKGYRDTARGILTIFLYLAKYNKKVIQEGLKMTHRKRLKEITFELFSSFVPKTENSIMIKGAISSISLPFQNEKELQKYLVEHPAILEDALQDSISVVGTEIPVSDYFCDIVVESDTYCYPIELKIRQSNHVVVSQCDKYCFYFYRKLRYDRYKKVQGVVISNGFDKWSINELRRKSILCFCIRMNDEKNIHLEEIKSSPN